MSTPLRIFNQRAYDAAREAARNQLQAIRGFAPAERQVEAMASAVIKAYQDVMVGERKMNQRIGRTTREMAHMDVGGTLVLRAASRSCLRQNMKTSRRLMGNLKASWALHEREDGLIAVTRLLDGAAPARDPRNNMRAVQISCIHIGQSTLCGAFPTVHALAMNTKVAARRLLNDERANWSAKTTNKGVRITRIA